MTTQKNFIKKIADLFRRRHKSSKKLAPSTTRQTAVVIVEKAPIKTMKTRTYKESIRSMELRRKRSMAKKRSRKATLAYRKRIHSRK